MQPLSRTGQRVARDPGLLGFAGALLLLCAPVFPGLSRLVVLPALLLAPGYALLRLLGRAAGTRTISVAVPVSLVLAICASMLLDVSGVRLGPLSLGLLLGAITALFLACSYGRQVIAGPRRWSRHDRLAPAPARRGDDARGDLDVHLLPVPARPSQRAIPQSTPAAPDIRVAAEQPNECWQSDFTRYVLAGGAGVEILSWLDAHSRLALSVTAYHAVTGQDVLASFRAAVAAYGPPVSTLTSDDRVYTTRLSDGGNNGFEHELRLMGITHKNGRTSHPQTQAKVQRFQRTLKRWLRARSAQPETLADLQALLDNFTAYYNHQRPHRSLRRTIPAAAYAGRRKANRSDRVGDTHDRVRAEYVGKGGTVTLRYDGRLHQVGIGRKHARAPILILVQNSRIRIIHARTGELLSDLSLELPGATPTTPPGDQGPGRPDATE